MNECKESNAPATLLYYMRPYISNLTLGAGYPPLLIPLLNFKGNKTEYVKCDDFNKQTTYNGLHKLHERLDCQNQFSKQLILEQVKYLVRMPFMRLLWYS